MKPIFKIIRRVDADEPSKMVPTIFEGEALNRNMDELIRIVSRAAIDIKPIGLSETKVASPVGRCTFSWLVSAGLGCLLLFLILLLGCRARSLRFSAVDQSAQL